MTKNGKDSRHQGKYVSVAERYQQGTLKFVEPLDFILLDALPKQGATVAGVIPLGMMVGDLAANVLAGAVDAGMVAGRMKSMQTAGLVVPVVMPKNDAYGWQVTPEGEKALAASEYKKSTNEGGN